MITQKELQELIHYNLETGLFTWAKDRHSVQKGAIAGGAITFPHNNKSYWCIRVKGVLYRAHRLAWLYMYGDIDSELQIDHINNDSLDNRASNLRLVTGQENVKNKRKYKTNKTGATGVYKQASGNWWAEITCNKVKHYLGTFKTLEEAMEARTQKKKELGFTKQHGE